MLGSAETLVGRLLGSLRELRRGLERQKLLKTDNECVSARCPRIYKKYNRPSIESIQWTIESIQP